MAYQQISGRSRRTVPWRWIIRILIGVAVAAVLVFVIVFALVIVIPLIALILIAFFVYYLIRRQRSVRAGSGPAGVREILVDSDQYYTDEGEDDREGG